MFLSGGQSEEEATINLNMINEQARETGRHHWGLSFSFGRSLQVHSPPYTLRLHHLIGMCTYEMPHVTREQIHLQASVLEVWSKDMSSLMNKQRAQELAVRLACANAAATLGQYTGPHPSLSFGSLKEGFRGWHQ